MESTYRRSLLNGDRGGPELITFSFEISGARSTRCSDNHGRLCIEDYGSFPPSIAKAVIIYKATDVSLALSRGLWRSDQWGRKPSEPSTQSAPTGGMLMANLLHEQRRHNNTSSSGQEVAKRWRALKGMISGQFCAALNENNVETAPIIHSYDILGSNDSHPVKMYRVSQFFPAETVCTENFDSWAHFLSSSFPTAPGSLLSTALLEDDWLFRTPWHSLQFSVSARDSKLYPNAHTLRATATISAVILPHAVPSHQRLLERLRRIDSISDRTEKSAPSDQDQSKHIHAKQRTVEDDSNNVKLNSEKLESNVENTANDGDSKCEWAVQAELHRVVRDSRLREIAVDTEVKFFLQKGDNDCHSGGDNCTTTRSRGKNSEGGRLVISCQDTGNTSVTVRITEPVPAFYDIFLHTYQYSMHRKQILFENRPSSGGWRKEKEGYVADLKTFQLTSGAHTDEDCFLSSSSETGQADYNNRNPVNTLTYDRYRLDRQRCFGSLVWSVQVPLNTLNSGDGNADSMRKGDQDTTFNNHKDDDPLVVLRASFTATKRHLHREAYPADASRGLEVPPVYAEVTLSSTGVNVLGSNNTCRTGISSISSAASSGNYSGTCSASYRPYSSRGIYLISDPALITMPIPDASMPFNIITLVSTVLAFLLGSIMNALLRLPQKKVATTK